MSTAERRGKIIELLEVQGSVKVEELATRFQVSSVTIRKDLDELERRGLVRRSHGSAEATSKSLYNPSMGEKIAIHNEDKFHIALAAAELVEEGDTVLLDSGSTTLTLAKVLKNRFQKLYIITNSIPISLEFSDRNWEVVLLGGTLRPHSGAAIGPTTVDNLQKYYADKVFLGTTSISVDRGYATPNIIEAQTKEAMIRAARMRVVVSDSSKIGRHTLASFAALQDIDVLVTDPQAPPGFLDKMKDLQLKVVFSSPIDPANHDSPQASLPRQN
ncbi:DeoR/GlpR family DNA-binding transcription regulator [Deinococcus cellulosilyticus]|uniref:DeoR family transcriptional regulator n=2 Tax=Deinococcus cellulosilyticus TaxID=401558 RepID=A0A511N0A2_DEIC1|nr:DeoR family transcriptional regulator [Deinococcus cellulosilyticus NBRC 106333 = KACC 11606]